MLLSLPMLWQFKVPNTTGISAHNSTPKKTINKTSKSKRILEVETQGRKTEEPCMNDPITPMEAC